MKPFSQLIREKRQEKGYSMDKLCSIVQEEAGLKMSKSLLNFLEKGQRVPTYEMAYGLARTLDINIEIAIPAAHLARITRDLDRERNALEKFVEQKNIDGIELDKIYRLVRRAET